MMHQPKKTLQNIYKSTENGLELTFYILLNSCRTSLGRI